MYAIRSYYEKAEKTGSMDVRVKGYIRRNIPKLEPSTSCREAGHQPLLFVGSKPRDLDAQRVGLLVITSYSIHYTKLYESRMMIARTNPEMIVPGFAST